MTPRDANSAASGPALLIPPRRLRLLPGWNQGDSPVIQSQPRNPRPEAGAFEVGISSDRIELRARDAAGFLYARQTLEELRTRHGDRLPALELSDWPDFPIRGFYHDVTRGKVPTLDTLLALAERCAAHRLNHLQLYIEHTYAFREHPEVWQGASPLTAGEILQLDARCAELHIDLVPSFSTFGHFYTWIHRKFPELNELERDVSGDPFTWWDRMAHYTLDCRDPRSLDLVAGIIREVAPLFRSRYFNICCDETFDLGTGKNREAAGRLGKDRLYVDFLNAIIRVVHEVGRTPMFWGDIVRDHPGLLGEIAPDAVLLHWDYSRRPAERMAAKLAEVRRPFCVCSGVSGWNRWLPDRRTAHANIVTLARQGLAHGALGSITTDWGDCGHINCLGPSFPEIALAGASAWNARSASLGYRTFYRRASRLLLGDGSGELADLLGQAASTAKAEWTTISRNWQPRSPNMPDDWFDARSGLFCDLLKFTPRAHRAALRKLEALTLRIDRLMDSARPGDPVLAAEIRLGLHGLRLMEKLALVCHHHSGNLRRPPGDAAQLAAEFQAFDLELAHVWGLRNKPSELERIREVLRAITAYLQGGRRANRLVLPHPYA